MLKGLEVVEDRKRSRVHRGMVRQFPGCRVFGFSAGSPVLERSRRLGLSGSGMRASGIAFARQDREGTLDQYRFLSGWDAGGEPGKTGIELAASLRERSLY